MDRDRRARRCSGWPPATRETGAAVVANVDYVQFTGSTATGRKVAVACAERLIPYSLELGGKDPAIVLADADLERAANGIAWGGVFNSGQACVSVERVYVEEPVYDEFVAKLTDKVGRLRQGQDDHRYRFDVGAMATAAQRDMVARHVDEAVAAGARVTTGGKPTGVGTFFQPTVLADVDQSMSCMTEETFGPDAAGGQGRRRGRGDPAGQRLGLRPVGDGVDPRRRQRANGSRAGSRRARSTSTTS